MHDVVTGSARSKAPRVVAAALLASLPFASACRQGIFDDGDARWRVPSEKLRRIESIDPAAASTTPPVPVEEATRERLSDLELPARPGEEVALSIGEVRATVLERNLDLRVRLIDPAIAAEAVAGEEAKFNSVFFAGYNRDNNGIVADLAQGRPAESESANLGVRIPLATGGDISLSTEVNRSPTGVSFGDPGDDWLAGLRFSMSQPLLRGAGVNANTHSIRVANWQGQIADARTKLEAIRVLANADKAYWALYVAYRELEIRRNQHEIAVELLERAQRRIDQGTTAPVEVIRAESGVGRTLESILVADLNLRIRQRALKRLMNREDLPVSSATPLKPATDPSPVGIELDGRRLVEEALVNRMEMLELELQLAIDQSEIGFRRNAALPLFVLDYGYNIQGAGGEVNEAYGSFGGADSFNVGMRAEIPLGNEVLESRLNQAILQRVQRLGTREARRQAIQTEVYDALDALGQSWQRILAARLETVLAGRTLEAEQRQFEAGRRTATEVLDASTRLADAQVREVNALASYQTALVDIAFATGTSLGAQRIRWEPFSMDELPVLEQLPGAVPAERPGGFRIEDAGGAGGAGSDAAPRAPGAAPPPAGAPGAHPAAAPAADPVAEE
jgi:outer membrane protein